MWGEPEVWEEIRSPVLAAPSFNDGLGTISSTHFIDGADEEETQAANDLCERYIPLALKIAGRYRDRGIHFEDLKSAALTGLVTASRKFHPIKGAFGPYASHWIKGEIIAKFKGNNPLDGAVSLTIEDEKSDETSHQREVAAPAPIISPDLSELAETDRCIIQSRNRGETLAEIGKKLGISAERIRQREAKARSKVVVDRASQWISELTTRGDVIRFPHEPARRWIDFKDRAPPAHTYLEPQLSRRITHNRANASRLAALRGNGPMRRVNGPYGGAIVIYWGRQ